MSKKLSNKLNRVFIKLIDNNKIYVAKAIRKDKYLLKTL